MQNRILIAAEVEQFYSTRRRIIIPTFPDSSASERRRCTSQGALIGWMGTNRELRQAYARR